MPRGRRSRIWGWAFRSVWVGVALAVAGCGRTETLDIQTLDDARTARIGVMTGSTGEGIAKRRFPDADIRSFDDVMDAVAAMSAGQLDATVTAIPSATQVIKKNPGLRIVDGILENEDTAIAARLGDTELLAQVNRALDAMRADGTLADMRARWFKPDLSPYEVPELELPTQGELLRIGVAATREPFSFVDQDGEVSGHDGELARRLSVALERPIEFSDMRFMALIPALQSGRVDLIVTGMSATAERRQQVAFSDPYFANAQILFVREVGAGGGGGGQPGLALTSMDELAKLRVGVFTGTAHESYMLSTYPDAPLAQYNNPADLVLAIKQNRVDGALFDEDPLLDIMRQDPSIGILGAPLFSFDVGAGFNRTSDPLREEFNALLAELRASGVYDDMVRRWMREQITEMPVLDNPGTNGPLVVGISTVGLPFIAVQDNRLVGFDIELAERFAARLGRELRLSNMDFGSLIASVSSGRSDLIISSIFITAERSQQIDFSDPYYEMATVAAALKSNIAGQEGEAQLLQADDPGFFGRVARSFEANLIRENRYRLIVDGLRTTVLISLLSTIFGTALGALVCAMRMSKLQLLQTPARIYIAILRGTPVLVVLMLVFYVVFASVNISPVLVAVIAFGMNFAAYVSEIFRTGIEGIDPGQSEAGLSVGFTRVQTFVYILLPQTIQRILPVYKGEFISMVKMTSIVGYIAVQDLTKASDIIRSRTFDAFFPLVMVAILYLIISSVLTQALDALERRTDPRFRRRSRSRS